MRDCLYHFLVSGELFIEIDEVEANGYCQSLRGVRGPAECQLKRQVFQIIVTFDLNHQACKSRFAR